MCIRHMDVYTVCCHVRLGKTEPCSVAKSIKLARNCTWSILPWPLTACMARTEEHLCFSFCPRCAHYFSGGGSPYTDAAVLNYWTYKNRHGFRGPVEPILVPIANIYQPVKADYTDAYLLHRLELSALASAVREDTVRKWFDKEINKDGRVVEEWSLISALGHIRQEILAQAFARQFVQPIRKLAGNSSPTAPPRTAKERRPLRSVKVKQDRSSPLSGNPSHVVARMEIRGNTDGLHSPFIVHVDGYHTRRNIKAASQDMGPDRFGPKTDNETELQQLDSVEPRMASRLSNLFVVGDDSDDDDDLAEEDYSKDLHDTLGSGQEDVASDGNAVTSPVKIASRHKPILCSIGHIPSLRASTCRQPMAGDTMLCHTSSIRSVRPEIESTMTPTVVTITPTLVRQQSLYSLQGERAYLPDIDSVSAASSPLVLSLNGKSDIDFDHAETDTFRTPEKPAVDHKPIQVPPDGYLCDDDSGYNSDCDDGHSTALPLTADKLVNVAKLKKHMDQTFGVGEPHPKIINNIKALRPGRKAYQDYPDYTVDAWEEDRRDPATIPTVLRMPSPDIESRYLSNRPECTTPPPDAWEYTDAVKIITHRLGVALGGKDRPLVYGLMCMPPQKRRFVMEGLVNLYGSAKAAMGQLPPRTPSPPWLGRPLCLSPLSMTPVQEPEADIEVCPEDAQFTIYRTYPRRPLSAAPIQTAETDIEPAAEEAQVEECREFVPLPFTPSPDLDVEQQVLPGDAPSVEYQAYRPTSLSSSPIQLPDVDSQTPAEDSESTDLRKYNPSPLPFTPSPGLDAETQTLPMDVSCITSLAY